jgi:hypothetical protein
VGETVIVKFGPGTLLFEGISFHVPFQGGKDWLQPKQPIEIALTSTQVFSLII